MFRVFAALSRVLPALVLVCYWLASPLTRHKTTAAISKEGDDIFFENETRPASNISELENTCLHDFNWTVNSSDEALELLGKFGVFYSLESAMKIFKSKHCRTNRHVTTLLENFHTYCPNVKEKTEKPPMEKRVPFIAVECVDLKTKNILTQKLSQKLKAMTVYNPPNFMRIAGRKFNRTHIMRRSFFTLGNYATGYTARTTPVRMPVVTSGYWVDQAVFRVAKTFRNNLPPEGSIVYSWPENLYQPDIHFFVNHKPKPIPTTGLESVDMKSLMIEIYRRWRGANFIEINSTIVYLEIVSIMINNINRVLNTTYVRPRNITSLH